MSEALERLARDLLLTGKSEEEVRQELHRIVEAAVRAAASDIAESAHGFVDWP